MRVPTVRVEDAPESERDSRFTYGVLVDQVLLLVIILPSVLKGFHSIYVKRKISVYHIGKVRTRERELINYPIYVIFSNGSLN